MDKYIEVAAEFGLTVSIPKTKLMATGRQATADDRAPILVDGGAIESVPEFPYLGSVVSATGRVKPDVDRRVARASRAFGALRKPVFNNRDLKLETKWRIYQACVLSVLLYGSESWTPLRRDLRRLDSFHHRCVRNILRISNEQQWTQRLTHRCIRQRWGDNETATEIITKRRLEWLGHLARMQSQRIPKITLFSWLPQRRPQGGPRKRWKDVIRKDLSEMEIKEEEWFEKATSSRAEWRSTYRQARTNLPYDQPLLARTTVNLQVQCPQCHRMFRRESGRKRHKCLAERQKPVSEQVGAAQCTSCRKWFRSRGGMAVHRCRPDSP